MCYFEFHKLVCPRRGLGFDQQSLLQVNYCPMSLPNPTEDVRELNNAFDNNLLCGRHSGASARQRSAGIPLATNYFKERSLGGLT